MDFCEPRVQAKGEDPAACSLPSHPETEASPGGTLEGGCGAGGGEAKGQGKDEAGHAAWWAVEKAAITNFLGRKRGSQGPSSQDHQ